MDAIARMNYLHGPYRRAGKILDDDMLYTLSLFALEPMRWTRRYEWRELTPLEICALGVVWRDIGAGMEISYAALESHMTKERDGLAWMDALDRWSTAYELKNLVPAESNGKIAKATMDLFLIGTPSFMHTFTNQIVTALMDPRLRRAVLYVVFLPRLFLLLP
jgi:hypothetical protein